MLFAVSLVIVLKEEGADGEAGIRQRFVLGPVEVQRRPDPAQIVIRGHVALAVRRRDQKHPALVPPC